MLEAAAAELNIEVPNAAVPQTETVCLLAPSNVFSQQHHYLKNPEKYYHSILQLILPHYLDIKLKHPYTTYLRISTKLDNDEVAVSNFLFLTLEELVLVSLTW